MKLTIQLAALVLSPIAQSLKCWMGLTHQGGSPFQNPMDIDSGYSCFRMNHTCAPSDVTIQSHNCYEKAVGFSYTTYGGFYSNDQLDEFQKTMSSVFACSSPNYCNAPEGYTEPTDLPPGLKCFKNGQFNKTVAKEVDENPPGFTCFRASRPCNPRGLEDPRSQCFGKEAGSLAFIVGSGTPRYHSYLKALNPNLTLTSCDTDDYCNEINISTVIFDGNSSTFGRNSSTVKTSASSVGVAPFAMVSFVGATLVYIVESLLF